MSDDNQPRRRFRLSPRRSLVLAGAGLLALGGAVGAVVMAQTRPSVSMAPAVPVAIRSLSSSGIVTIRGRVVEVYGDRFVMADATGRALVDTGPEGDDRALVIAGEPVTVQGRFDHGFVRAAFLVAPGGKVVALGPLGRPFHGPHGDHDHEGHGPDRPAPARPAGEATPGPGASPAAEVRPR